MHKLKLMRVGGIWSGINSVTRKAGSSIGMTPKLLKSSMRSASNMADYTKVHSRSVDPRKLCVGVLYIYYIHA